MMSFDHTQPTCADYHVAWICALADVELLPARLMLDNEHSTPSYNTHYDDNTYICGSISGHAVVIATCPQGETGNVNAGRLTGPLFKTFPNIRITVLVGIGGGIPRADVSEDSLDNIHLGDVVVGWPGDGKPACVYYDRGKSKVNGEFEMVGTMQNPDWRVINALGILASDHELGRTKFDEQLARLLRHKTKKKFLHPGLEYDRLFKATYSHIGDKKSKCVACDQNELVQRPQRSENEKHELVFHRGRIATGNSVIQDGKLRDEIGARCYGALCVEMEAAGVDANRRCLVIRGISDYADSHKNDMWQSHAAANAAAFTRELLRRIQAEVVKDIETVSEAPWFVPFSRPHSFVGRDTQLAQIHTHISSEACRRLAVHGLGGCGKTALALESVYQTRERQPTRAIFWVPAISRESFEQAYREIGVLLRIPGITDEKADVKKLVKARLSDESFGQWLIIIDNTDDIDVLFNPADRLIDYLPQSRRGSIIFTTRTAQAAADLAGSNVIELGKLNELEAKEVLRTRLFPKYQHQLENEEIVDEFLHMLTFLALAIVQAIAFINKNSSNLTEYVQLYKASEKEATTLLSKEFEDQGRYQETKNPVTTTWYISFEQIRKQNTLAASYLSFMACIANNQIPESMLPESILPEISSKVEQTETIGMLKAYAFIAERQPQNDGQSGHVRHLVRTFDVHPLVHLAMQSWLKAQGQWNHWVEKSLMRLVEIVPFGDYKTRELWTTYLPHAMHVVDLPEADEMDVCVSLLDRIGSCEQRLGRYKASETTRRRILNRLEQKLGKEHPHTLTSMHNIANALFGQGKYAEVEKICRETVLLREKVSGREHPHTIPSLNNLAKALHGQGKYAEAEMLIRESLLSREKASGKEHPETMTSMNNLAQVLSSQGNYAEAEEIYRETVLLREKVSGKEHPHTLSSMSNLVGVMCYRRKYAEAEKLCRETLLLDEKVLGRDHPHTMTCMGNLAKALLGQRKYAEAEMVIRESLLLREKASGKEHPETMTSMNNLAQVLTSQGNYAEAEEIYRETVLLKEKVSGKEHPHTLTSMANLVEVLCNQGKYAEAEKICRETVLLREKVLGKEHPRTLRLAARLTYITNHERAGDITHTIPQQRSQTIISERTTPSE